MKQKTFLDHYLYRFLCTSLLTGIAAMCTVDYYHFTIPRLVAGIFVLLCVLSFHLFYEYRKTPIPYIILGITALVAVLFIERQWNAFQVWLTGWYEWLYQMALEEESSVGEGTALLYMIMTLAVVNLSGIFFAYLVNRRIRRKIIAVLLVAAVPFCLHYEYDPGKSVAALSVAYLFLCLIELSFQVQYNADAQRSSAAATYLTPFAAVMLIICLLLPQSSKPMKFEAIHYLWNQLKDCAASIQYNFGHWFTISESSDFSLSFAGFSEDAVLGDGINENSKSALHVYDSSLKATNLYLIGTVKNTFVGNGWVNTVEDQELAEREYELDVFELANTLLKDHDNLSAQNIAYERDYTVEYQGNGTKVIFYPERSALFRSVHNVNQVVSQADQIYFEKTPGYKGKYEVIGIELKLGTQECDDFLINHSKQPYQWGKIDSKALAKEVNRYLSSLEVEEIPDLSNMLKKRSERIYRDYLNLPKDLSKTVKELAIEITKGAGSDYERLKRIEAYLNSFQYSTRPKQPEHGKPLLEYFLFESKEGYCTYFATAMTILSRCIGIPSRFVQGYCAPAVKNKYEYDLSGNNAHAWSDAYLEGIGWVSFEPTAGYSDLRYHAREVYKKMESSGETASLLPYDQSYYEKMARRAMENDRLMVEETEYGITKSQSYLFVILIILGVVLLIIVSSLGYLFLRIRLMKRSYHKAGVRQRLYILLKRTMILVKELKLGQEENMTVMEQFSCLYHLESIEAELVTKACQSYQVLCYGEAALSSESVQSAEQLYEQLLLYTKGTMKMINYIGLQFKLVKQNAEKTKTIQ